MQPHRHRLPPVSDREACNVCKRKGDTRNGIRTSSYLRSMRGMGMICFLIVSWFLM
jgi:hypothetical protein